MNRERQNSELDRRAFVKRLAGMGGAALVAGYAGVTPASATGIMGASTAPVDWREKIGLQLYTVRDQTAKDYPGTLKKVAEIGYKAVQTTGSYGDYTAQQIHQFLDDAGLVSPATHVSPHFGAADFEKTLEGYQLIGHKYTTIAFDEPVTGPAPAPPPAPSPGAAPPTMADMMAYLPASWKTLQPLDAVMHTAEQLNKAGEITRKYGIKVIVHNHTIEFRPLSDSPQLEYAVLLRELDPDLVSLELDIGWATAAGQNAIDMFMKDPGRFEVWHVKDMANLASLKGKTELERLVSADIVPIGEGEIDYGPIFAQAALAGMQHYFVEQDSAPASGDSLADAAKDYRNLMSVLSS